MVDLALVDGRILNRAAATVPKIGFGMGDGEAFDHVIALVRNNRIRQDGADDPAGGAGVVGGEKFPRAKRAILE